jgi:hypothetical protein
MRTIRWVISGASLALTVWVLATGPAAHDTHKAKLVIAGVILGAAFILDVWLARRAKAGKAKATAARAPRYGNPYSRTPR